MAIPLHPPGLRHQMTSAELHATQFVGEVVVVACAAAVGKRLAKSRRRIVVPAAKQGEAWTAIRLQRTHS